VALDALALVVLDCFSLYVGGIAPSVGRDIHVVVFETGGDDP